MFYTFRQNNSGGSFDFDEDAGITHFVIVEAEKSSSANSIAENIGLYWNGCETGDDCGCCGDRWNKSYESDAEKKPSYYGKELTSDTFKSGENYIWMKEGKEACVHYLDGRKEWF